MTQKTLKRDSLSVTNSLSSAGVLIVKDGYLYLDNRYNTNNDLPRNSLFGTAPTQGNVVSQRITINNNGPVRFGPSQDDIKQQIGLFPNIIKDFPIGSKFPWLYPITQNWTQQTQTILASSSPEIPITKVLGKGLGEITIFKVSDPLEGSSPSAGISQGNTIIRDNSSYVDKPIYPFDGYIQSGTLIEIIADPQGNPVAIPYQSGRGIPQYATNFQPGIPREYLPWGELKWPDGSTVWPYLSPGAQENIAVGTYGVVLDSYSDENYENRRIKSYPRNDVPDDTWYNHPAPQTIPPKSYKSVLPGQTQITQGFLSPGPCLANNFWAPWPRYYSYKSGDPLPVLTKGITTVRIGAASNIALTTYGIKSAISATNNVWVPVPIIPLFEGESLQAGSLVYGAVKGKIQTGGPYVPDSAINNQEFSALVSGILGQTLWDVNADSTWGNVGWCGTPGLGFQGIPDTGTSIIETLDSQTIPYLVQSNQGTIIVSGVTNVSPYPGLGNKFTNDTLDNDELFEVEKARFELPGISGRGCLSQEVPEMAQPIGVLMETIEGTGKWPYTGLLKSMDDTQETVIADSGGSNYIIGVDLNTNLRNSEIDYSPPPTYTLLGTVTFTSSDSEYPTLGQIQGLPVPSGFFNEIVTVFDDSLTYGFPQYKGNNASYFTSLDSIVTSPGGFYSILFSNNGINILKCFNLSANNAYLSFISDDGIVLNRDNIIAPIAPLLEYPQYFQKYQIGQYIRVLGPNIEVQNCNVFVIDAINYNTGQFTLTKIHSGTNFSVGIQGVYNYMETEILNYNYRHPSITILENNLASFEVIDYGAGALKGDKLLAVNSTIGIDQQLILSGDNGLLEFGGVPQGFQELVSSCPWYYSEVTGDNSFNYEVLPLSPTISLVVNNGYLLRPDLIRIINKFEQIPAWYEEKIPYSFIPTPALEYNVYIKVFYNSNLPGGATSIAEPNYIGSSYTLKLTNISSGLERYAITPAVGGTRYPSMDINGISCYNMSANTLRVPLTVVDGLLSQETVTYTITDENYNFNRNRYVADPINGTQFRIMSNILENKDLTIYRLTNVSGNDITLTLVSVGSSYGLANGTYLFHTQRVDQTDPIVDITTTLNKYIIAFSAPNLYKMYSVSKVRLVEAGIGNEQGDIMLIPYPDSDNNAFFLFNNNIPELDLPPYARVPGYKVDTSEDNWDKYNEAMQTATNLLDKQVLIELRNSNGDYMDKVGPSGQQSTNIAPSNKNPYREYYP